MPQQFSFSCLSISSPNQRISVYFTIFIVSNYTDNIHDKKPEQLFQFRLLRSNNRYFMKKSYSFTPPKVSPVTKYFCKNGYRHTIGNIVNIVAAARTEVGVTVPAACFMDSTEFP